MQRELRTPAKIGIALSGGTLKAAAHIGVLSALEELGIRPACVAGTSAGSFVAALYAHGYKAREFDHLIHSFPGPRLLDYGFPVYSSVMNYLRYRFQLGGLHHVPSVPSGLMRGRKLRAFFEQALKNRTAALPFYIQATDLVTGKPVVFTNDNEALSKKIAEPISDLASVIQGSCTLPGILSPVRVGDWLLVDGAFRHYVPVQVLRKVGCDKIIVVNLYRLEQHWQPRTIGHVLARSFDILLQESIEDDTEGNDLFVLEPDVSELTWTSFHKLKTSVKMGRDTVLDNRHPLLNFLNSAPVRLHKKKPPRTGA